jgi:hypothetical protein
MMKVRMKEVNRFTSNEFHVWQRENLPGKFAIWDVDTWALVVSDSTLEYEPLALIELKRSFADPTEWKPYEADKPNYLAAFKLARRANLPFLTIYFMKGKSLSNADAKIALLRISDVRSTGPNWINYRKEIVSPVDFRAHFPSILSE